MKSQRARLVPGFGTSSETSLISSSVHVNVLKEAAGSLSWDHRLASGWTLHTHLWFHQKQPSSCLPAALCSHLLSSFCLRGRTSLLFFSSIFFFLLMFFMTGCCACLSETSEKRLAPRMCDSKTSFSTGDKGSAPQNKDPPAAPSRFLPTRLYSLDSASLVRSAGEKAGGGNPTLFGSGCLRGSTYIQDVPSSGTAWMFVWSKV